MIEGLRPKIIILATVLCSLVLFGMYFGYTKIFVDNPLLERIESFEQVEFVEIDSKDKLVKVALRDKNNFPDTYRKLVNELGTTGYRIEIIDNPSENLLNYFYRAQFIIQEAKHKGNYQEMLIQLEDLARNEHVSANFYIDDQHLYIDLEKDNSNFMTVLSREQLLEDVSLND